ncbi:MAG: hypothetical protein U1E89_07060 [Burkholderiaceae bacterium]
MASGAAMAQTSARGLLGMGLTTGGDTLATVVFTDGTTESIKAGGLVHVFGGVEFRATPQVTMQLNGGYQVDDTSRGSNGSLRFSRYPIEVLAHYQLNPAFRLGGGLRLVNSPKIRGSGVLSGTGLDFESTTGAVFEGEYLVTPNIGLKLRGVSETYKPKNGSPSADGNHIGFYFTWYI